MQGFLYKTKDCHNYSESSRPSFSLPAFWQFWQSNKICARAEREREVFFVKYQTIWLILAAFTWKCIKDFFACNTLCDYQENLKKIQQGRNKSRFLVFIRKSRLTRWIDDQQTVSSRACYPTWVVFRGCVAVKSFLWNE